MTIKLRSRLAIKDESISTLSYADGVLTKDGTETDLTALEYTELDEGETQDTSVPYMDSDGVIHILLIVDTDRQHLFINSNYLKFYDTDLNGSLDSDEFEAFVTTWNKTRDERREVHKSVRSAFIEDYDTEAEGLEAWRSQ